MSEQEAKVVGYSELKQMMDKKYEVKKPSWDDPEYVGDQLLLRGFFYSGKVDNLPAILFKGYQAITDLRVELGYLEVDDNSLEFDFTVEEYNEIANRLMASMVAWHELMKKHLGLLMTVVKGYGTLVRLLKEAGKYIEPAVGEMEEE